ncbi:capping complex subunit for YIEGIA [Brevibacillus sp. H7]|uniref:capping complex subunit for YIEGIA n=1 Tax=Brevibacillus sp. H7 TaxID=3349138 RepID=UPI00380EE4F3
MESKILAVITTQKDRIAGGAPIFVVENQEQLQQTAFTLEKVLDAMVHEVNEQTLVVVRH